MRLLKTGPYVPGDEKLEVIQKWGKDIPAYAILSHTWSTNPDDEVLLSDVQNGTCDKKPAYSKLEKAMERAMLDGWGWLWIDTCCIDKTSSVELSEAINSMYAYYKNSQKCYAYLADVESEKAGPEFKSSRWWKRGWTLQELLAPRDVEFFNRTWRVIGRKENLHEVISQRTGIEYKYLTGALPVEHASIAKRMSWAASRETTRDEDIAYSMIGLFDVSMPMLYGEGPVKAFIRLQEEIMSANEDQSLFAWVNDGKHSHHGLLADSPKDFEKTGNTTSYTDISDYKPFAMTARGLNIWLPIIKKSNDRVVAALHCPVPGGGYNGWLAVYLQPLQTGTDQYARVDCNKLASVSEQGYLQEIYVRQKFQDYTVQAVYPNHYFQIRSLRCTSHYEDHDRYKIVESVRKNIRAASTVLRDAPPTAEPQPWSVVPLVYTIEKQAGSLTMALRVKRMFDEEAFVIMLGARSDLDVGVTIRDDIAFGAGTAFIEMQKAFNPQPLGTFVELKFHNVRVSAQELVRPNNNQKIYLIDIEITALPKLPTATEILEGAIDSIIPGQGRGAARTDFRDKVKRRLLPMR